MADDVARAIGAKEPEPILIDGKPCYARPLTLRELAELERDCLSRWRKEQVNSLKDSLSGLEDVIDNETRTDMLKDRAVEVSKVTLKELPPRFVYEPGKIELTNELRKWVETNLSGYLLEPNEARYDESIRGAASNALENGVLTENHYTQLTKKAPRKTSVPYVNWWITGSMDGRLSMAHAAFQTSGVTRDQVNEAMRGKPGVLQQIVRDIERLTAPDVGNG